MTERKCRLYARMYIWKHWVAQLIKKFSTPANSPSTHRWSAKQIIVRTQTPRPIDCGLYQCWSHFAVYILCAFTYESVRKTAESSSADSLAPPHITPSSRYMITVTRRPFVRKLFGFVCVRRRGRAVGTDDDDNDGYRLVGRHSMGRRQR